MIEHRPSIWNPLRYLSVNTEDRKRDLFGLDVLIYSLYYVHIASPIRIKFSEQSIHVKEMKRFIVVGSALRICRSSSPPIAKNRIHGAF